MKITKLNEIKMLCGDLNKALNRFYVGIVSFIPGREQEMIDDLGLAYDIELKAFVPVKGCEVVYQNQDEYLVDHPRKFYSLARIKHDFYTSKEAKFENRPTGTLNEILLAFEKKSLGEKYLNKIQRNITNLDAVKNYEVL